MRNCTKGWGPYEGKSHCFTRSCGDGGMEGRVARPEAPCSAHPEAHRQKMPPIMLEIFNTPAVHLAVQAASLTAPLAPRWTLGTRSPTRCPSTRFRPPHAILRPQTWLAPGEDAHGVWLPIRHGHQAGRAGGSGASRLEQEVVPASRSPLEKSPELPHHRGHRADGMQKEATPQAPPPREGQDRGAQALWMGRAILASSSVHRPADGEQQAGGRDGTPHPPIIHCKCC